MPALHRARSIARLAPVALMPAGALAVHELRYLLAFGPHASVALARSGHAYLHSLVPWIVLGAGLALGSFARSLGRAWAGERTPARYTLSLLALWAICSGALLAIYAGQESLEGLVATGHPAGWAGIVGFGGWWAVPASLLVGLVLAAAYHGARWALRTVSARGLRRRRSAGRSPARRRWVDVPGVAPAPVAAGWSGRGPPR